MRYLLCVLMCCVMCFGFANVANSQCDRGVCPLPPFVARGVVIVETPTCVVAVKNTYLSCGYENCRYYQKDRSSN